MQPFLYSVVLKITFKNASEDLIMSDILGTIRGIEALKTFFSITNAFKKHKALPNLKCAYIKPAQY